MKEWKKRALPILENRANKTAIDGCPCSGCTARRLVDEYEARRAEKRKAREAEAVPHLVGESWVKIKQEEARSFSESQAPQLAPLSDEYLALWVPRMEAFAKDGDSCVPRWNCNSRFRGYCPVGVALRNKPGACRDEARAWLARPDVVAWKERQKVSEWPKWISVKTDVSFADNGRRIVACYGQDDWYTYEGHFDPALATAAEIDAVRRPK
jgi:hypothetical protein